MWEGVRVERVKSEEWREEDEGEKEERNVWSFIYPFIQDELNPKWRRANSDRVKSWFPFAGERGKRAYNAKRGDFVADSSVHETTPESVSDFDFLQFVYLYFEMKTWATSITPPWKERDGKSRRGRHGVSKSVITPDFVVATPSLMLSLKVSIQRKPSRAKYPRFPSSTLCTQFSRLSTVDQSPTHSRYFFRFRPSLSHSSIWDSQLALGSWLERWVAGHRRDSFSKEKEVRFPFSHWARVAFFPSRTVSPNQLQKYQRRDSCSVWWPFSCKPSFSRAVRGRCSWSRCFVLSHSPKSVNLFSLPSGLFFLCYSKASVPRRDWFRREAQNMVADSRITCLETIIQQKVNRSEVFQWLDWEAQLDGEIILYLWRLPEQSTVLPYGRMGEGFIIFDFTRVLLRAFAKSSLQPWILGSLRCWIWKIFLRPNVLMMIFCSRKIIFIDLPFRAWCHVLHLDCLLPILNFFPIINIHLHIKDGTIWNESLPNPNSKTSVAILHRWSHGLLRSKQSSKLNARFCWIQERPKEPLLWVGLNWNLEASRRAH